jgi:hypothetical protein
MNADPFIGSARANRCQFWAAWANYVAAGYNLRGYMHDGDWLTLICFVCSLCWWAWSLLRWDKLRLAVEADRKQFRAYRRARVLMVNEFRKNGIPLKVPPSRFKSSL